MMRPERAQRLDSSPMAASGLEELKKQLERRRATGAHESPPLLRSDRAATPTKLRCREAQAAASAMTRQQRIMTEAAHLFE